MSVVAGWTSSSGLSSLVRDIRGEVRIPARRLIAIPAAEELLPDDSGRIRQVSPELGALIQSRPDITFFSAQGLLSFHAAAALEFELQGQRLSDPLILRMKEVHHIDATGLVTLEAIVDHRQRRGGRVILSAIQPEVLGVMGRFGLAAKVGRENLFEHTRDAIESIDPPMDTNPIHNRNLALRRPDEPILAGISREGAAPPGAALPRAGRRRATPLP